MDLPPTFSSRNLMVSGIIFKSLTYFEVLFFFVQYKIVAQFHSLTQGCPVLTQGCLVFPVPFMEETVLSSSYILDSFVINLLYVIIYFWALYFVPLIYVLVFMPQSYCFNQQGFAIEFEIKKCDVSSFVLLSQDCFGFWWSFGVPYILQDCLFYFSEKKSL